MSKTPELYVLDGHALLYKAHFAFVARPLMNSKGHDLSVTFGVTRMLMYLLKEQNPEYLAMAFDRKAPTFRHELYKEYKMHRPPMPAPIADNLPIVKQIVTALGIKILEHDGYEADDILGTIVRKFESQDVKVILVTSDKDLLHLVTDKVTVMAAKKGLSDFIRYNRDKVIEKYDVPPELMVDYFSLVGDSADNIPGIPGIGPVHAVKLLRQFGSLNELLARTNEIEAKGVRSKVEQGREFALLSKQLIQLKCNAPILDTIEQYRIEKKNDQQLFQLFTELEFHSLLPEVQVQSESIHSADYHTLTNREELMELARRVRENREFSVVMVRSGKSAIHHPPVGLGIGIRNHQAYFIPFGYPSLESQAQKDDVIKYIAPILEDPTLLKYTYNLKQLYLNADSLDTSIKGHHFDVLTAAYLIDPGKRNLSIPALSLEFLKRTTHHPDVSSGSLSAAGMDQLASASSGSICETVDIIYSIAAPLKKKIEENQLSVLLNEIEMPLSRVLADIESTGIKIDTDLLRRISSDLAFQLEKITKSIHLISGETFNINSPQQLATVLFDKLQYPVKGIKKTKTGYSTSENELLKLVHLGGLFAELPSKLLEYRSLFKLKTTYADTLPEMVDPATQRIHTQFNQTVAETGRLSSSDPNLQNIPIRSETGKSIRQAFIASEGNILLSADYSQMELRILAHIADDAAMIDAFKKDQDIHAATAASLFRVPMESVSAEQRRRAKMVNFGIDYGMTAFGLSERLGIPVNEARIYIDHYLQIYNGVKRYIEKTKQDTEKNGYVETLFGRKRYIPVPSDNKMAREAAYRQAINMPIQGTAADVIKIAMIQIHQSFRRENLKSRMVLQVHDELLFDVIPEELARVTEIVKHHMESATVLKVPLKISMNSGSNWAQIH